MELKFLHLSLKHIITLNLFPLISSPPLLFPQLKLLSNHTHPYNFNMHQLKSMFKVIKVKDKDLKLKKKKKFLKKKN